MAGVPPALSEPLRDRYVLERELGHGGMATVYLAHDLRHNRPVAFKVLHPDLAATLGPERFLREIRLAARLQHPHLLSVHDSGETSGQLWFTMPFVEGETLRDRLRRERQLPVEDAVRITQEVADALDYAHRHGVIHRDIKPENILLTERHALVGDFGIARALAGDEAARLTETGIAVGTAAYMSPEQATGEREIDRRTDVYSLGCVLYEMLVGEPPFTGPSAQAIIAKRLTQAPTPVRVLRDGVPASVEQALSRALARLRADRFATAAEFLSALTGTAGPSIPRLSKPRRHARWKAAAVILGVAGAGLAVWLLWARWQPPARAAVASPADLNPRNIAVLYFDDMSGRGSLRYLADGLTEDVIDELSQVRPLDVISKNGILPYRETGTPVDSIARAMDAGTVLAGSVEELEERVRINVRLIDGASGADFRRASFAVTKSDLLAGRDSLVRQVADFLRQRLGEEIRVRRQLEGTRSADAWALVQRAEVRRKRADSLKVAGDTADASRELAAADSQLARAGSLDPAWAEPLVIRGLIAYTNSRSRGTEPEFARPWIQRGLVYAEKALALDPENADALESRGSLRYWQWLLQVDRGPDAGRKLLRAAQEDLEAATQINPTQAGAWSVLGHLYNHTSGTAAAKLASLRAYEADAYLLNADQVVWRLFISSYDLEEHAEAARWCEEGTRRFKGNYRFIECRLLVMGTPAASPNANLAWELIEKGSSVVPEGIWDFTERRWRTLVAIVLVRAGLRDSALRVMERARADSVPDPIVELPWWDTRAYMEIGDTNAAIQSLAAYARADPERKAEIRKGWPELRDQPLFKQLFTDR